MTLVFLQDMRRCRLSLALLAFGCAPASFGQAGKAELFGTIQDPQNLAVTSAKITCSAVGTGEQFTVVTDEHGDYHLLGLAAGQYVLAIEKPGFRPYRQEGITLRIGDQTRLDVKLEVGQTSTSVEVQAQTTLLETANGSVSYHVGPPQLETLPLDGRNFIPLVALSPGVALPGGGSLLPRINGSRPRTNEYLYDGISVLQPEPGQVVFYPIIDSMEEVKLNLNAYSPEYGRSNGGTVMVVGKSGGNDFHGGVFEFFRNEALNARNLFAQPGPKPEYRRNQYGFTLGGPIQKSKTFFFIAWQGTRQLTGITRFSTVPTVNQKNGIFTTTIYDPTTSPRQAFPANTIPVTRFDSVGRQVIARYPDPNLPG